MQVAENIQYMIDSNAGMVFYYAYSRPELLRTAHPILIVGKHVVCVEADTGKHKRFRLDGITFPETIKDINKVYEEIEQEYLENISSSSSSSSFYRALVSLDADFNKVQISHPMKDIICAHIRKNTPVIFKYTISNPERVRKVQPTMFDKGCMYGKDEYGQYKHYKLEHIRLVKSYGPIEYQYPL